MRAIRAVIAIAFALGLVLTAGQADAGRSKKKSGAIVAQKLGGKIVVSDKRFPMSASSENGYVSKVLKNKKTKLMENKDTKTWKVYFAAFFKKPLTDPEYIVQIYDTTDGGQLARDNVDQFADDSGGGQVLSYIELSRDTYGVNRKLLITVQNANHVVLASGTFQILGEAEHHSGKVNFSDSDASGSGDDGQAAVDK